MSNQTLSDTEAPITERVCRLTLNCKVRVGEITPEMLRKSIYWDARDPESSMAHAERQSRLLHALLRDELVLEQFLTYVVATDLCVLMGTGPDLGFHLEDEDTILKRVYPAAGEEGGPDIEESRSCDTLFDNTELFHACFKVDWGRTVLREVEVIPGDDDSEEARK
ncbi:MAG: hypothetical protein H0T60_09420 [Acidobacteria bacterium]|nr:hypothetical protein [Acidobacteriota bacterium]